MSSPTGFASVKLPVALVQQAREASQSMRRSVAGQIEYWATLGRIVEHTGVTVQEAQAAIEGYEAAARQTREKAHAIEPGDNADSLDALRQRLLAASTDGSLGAHIKKIVEDNRQRAKQQATV